MMENVQKAIIIRKEHLFNSFQKSIQYESATEEKEQIYKAAVGIVSKVSKDNEASILLGKSTIKDDREGKLVFPGGGIEEDETVYQTVKREVLEETGIYVECPPISIITDTDMKGVGFIICWYITGKIKPNAEFESLDWYPLDDLPTDEIYEQNMKIINKLITIN